VTRVDPIVSLRAVSKDYRGLRPLRVERLELRESETIALLGFDRAAAEVLVDLITAASLPDSGDVTIFGRETRAIADPGAWLRELDQFGILSERAILLDQLTAEQNLALPFSLELEEPSPALRADVRALADEVGISREELTTPVARLGPLPQARIRLGKALALKPRVLLAEHPNALVPAADLPTFAAEFSRIVSARAVALLALTADATFARSVAERVLALQPASGALETSSGWRSWFRRG
jgi:predicted ABC-type transport system involved in lysophospholipase L1 biosynthesis ATPase subunit